MDEIPTFIDKILFIWYINRQEIFGKTGNMTEKKNLLTKAVADRLIELILEHNLKPDDKLPNEYELAEMLGIGRSTVREAIRQLVSRNILVVRQGSGTFVSRKMGVPEDPLGLTFIGHDLGLALELSDVRMLVEPEAAELSAMNASDEQIEKMVELCEKIRCLVEEGSPYISVDLEIHRQIGESCGNSILRNLIFIIADAVNISINITKDRYRNVAYIEHKQIVDAIKRRDPIGARYAMMFHLNTGRQYFVEQKENL